MISSTFAHIKKAFENLSNIRKVSFRTSVTKLILNIKINIKTLSYKNNKLQFIRLMLLKLE